MKLNYNKYVRCWLSLISVLLAAILPMIVIISGFIIIPDPYAETFLGELSSKYDLIKEDGEGRIIIVGGSSAAFGFDSSMIAEYTGRKVVNFGLYADLGTKIMLDISRDFLRKGDLVVLSPELNSQTLSMYFKAESAWQALGGNPAMISHVGKDNYADLAGGIIKYMGSRFKYALDDTVLTPTGIYCRSSFNEYGDVAADRPYNVMTAGYDINQKISLTPDIFDPEFIDYVNAYIADAEKAGANVYFTFCPVNRSALVSETTDDSLHEFFRFVCESIHCPVIGSLQESLMDWGYFYDTNFHLNNAGVKVHTAALINDILRNDSAEYVDFEYPDPPGFETDTEDDPSQLETNEDEFFVYSSFGKAVAIVGVTEKGRETAMLTVPESFDGKNVVALLDGCFANCTALHEVTIGKNLTLMADGIFDGCDSLRVIHMKRENAEDLEAGSDLFDGAPENVIIKLYSETSFANFTSGYWWGIYSNRMELCV